MYSNMNELDNILGKPLSYQDRSNIQQATATPSAPNAAPGQAPAGSYQQQPYGAYQPPAGYYGAQPQAPVPGSVPQGGYGFPAYGYGGQQGGAPPSSQDN